MFGKSMTSCSLYGKVFEIWFGPFYRVILSVIRLKSKLPSQSDSWSSVKKTVTQPIFGSEGSVDGFRE